MNQETILKQAAEAAQRMPANGQTEQRVQPQPVPLSVRLGQTQLPDGQVGIFLAISTFVGESIYFLDAATAKRLGESLVKAGSASASGLVVP